MKQDQFFAAVASRQIPRIRVAGIVIKNGSVLVQKPTDDASSCYAFIGGEYELGDTFQSRLKIEFEEETNARIVSSTYLFCVENHFRHKDHAIQQIEHYFEVTLDRDDVESREPHLEHHWLPISELGKNDLRPARVRDVVADGSYTTVKHLVQKPE